LVSSLFGPTSLKNADLALEIDPFNYAAMQRRGYLNLSGQNIDDAIRDLKSAIGVRSSDYRVWMQLGSAYMQAGNYSEAHRSFERAIELAPNYSRPRWSMGNFLLENNDVDRAFTYLSQAAEREKDRIPDLIETALSRFTDAAALDKAIQLTSPEAQKRAALYFIEYRIDSRRSENFLSGPELGDDEKQTYVWLFIDKKKYRTAYRIWASQSRNLGRVPPEGGLLNGSFEELMDRINSGFGWVVDHNAQNITVRLTEGAASDGQRSIEVEFNGNSDPAREILSQMFVAQPNTNYTFSFSAKVENEFVSGGLPVIEAKDVDEGRSLALFQDLTRSDGKWKTYSATFRTSPNTSALRISLRRAGCEATQCPAFGKLALDNFVLQVR
jgi:tetratricopeptide (TPR) repeat protein